MISCERERRLASMFWLRGQAVQALANRTDAIEQRMIRERIHWLEKRTLILCASAEMLIEWLTLGYLTDDELQHAIFAGPAVFQLFRENIFTDTGSANDAELLGLSGRYWGPHHGDPDAKRRIISLIREAIRHAAQNGRCAFVEDDGAIVYTRDGEWHEVRKLEALRRVLVRAEIIDARCAEAFGSPYEMAMVPLQKALDAARALAYVAH